MMGLPEMIRPNTELVNDGALKLLTYLSSWHRVSRKSNCDL